MAPFEDNITHDGARLMGRNIVQRFAARDPRRYVTVADPKLRHGRIYLDYLRNGRGTTAVGALSPRARSGSPIAAPVTWADIEQGMRADALTIVKPFAGRPQRKGPR